MKFRMQTAARRLAKRALVTDAAPPPLEPPTEPRGAGSGVPAAVREAVSTGPDLAASPTTERQRRWGVRVLLLTAFCFGLGQTVIFAVLPPIAREAGLSEFQVTMIFGVSAVFWVLSSPRWGRRSDRVGRKPVVLTGLVAFVLAMLGLAAAIGVVLTGVMGAMAAFALMAAVRCVHGGVASAGPAASQAYIADRSSAEDRTAALAGFAAAFGIGTTMGPALGILGTLLGPLGPLILVALVGVLALGLIWRFVPEATQPQARLRPAPLKITDERLRRVLSYGLLSGIVTAMQLQFIGFYLIDTLGLDEAPLRAGSFAFGANAVVSAGLTLGAGAALFAQMVIVRVLKPSPRAMMRAAPVLVAAGFALIAAGLGFWIIALGLIVSGMGLGISYPAFNAAASLSVGAEDQGGAAGLATAAGASGFVLAPVIGSSLYAIGPDWPFLVGIVICAAMAVISWSRYATADPAKPTKANHA